MPTMLFGVAVVMAAGVCEKNSNETGGFCHVNGVIDGKLAGPPNGGWNIIIGVCTCLGTKFGVTVVGGMGPAAPMFRLSSLLLFFGVNSGALGFRLTHNTLNKL